MASGGSFPAEQEEEERTRLCLGVGGKGGGCRRRLPGARGANRSGWSAAAYNGSSYSGSGGVRKKLQITGEQVALLDHSFCINNILSYGVKHDLALRTGLQPRQVEVWFQNRRARDKLKQTEADRDMLRRRCQQLVDENALLRMEVAFLRSSSSAVPWLSLGPASAAHVGGGGGISIVLQQDRRSPAT